MDGVHPDDKLIGFALSSELSASGKLADAKTLLASLLVQTPSNPVLLNNLAGVQLRLGEEGAVATARLAHAAAPNSPEINDTLGWALTQAGQTDEGLAHLREAVARGSVNAEIRYHLGAALHALGRTQEAAYELKAALESGEQFAGRAEALALLQLQPE